jgi:hypothetical protein
LEYLQNVEEIRPVGERNPVKKIRLVSSGFENLRKKKTGKMGRLFSKAFCKSFGTMTKPGKL